MRKKYYLSLACGLLFLVLLFLVKKVNVAAIGPEGTTVGLSKMNLWVRNFVGVNEDWYRIANITLILAVLVGAVFATIGLVQLIKRKDLMKVDIQIFSMGCLYLILLALYFIFQLKVVNYRPMIMPGEKELEASFPSSHILSVVTVFGSANMIIDKYIKNARVLSIFSFVSVLVSVLNVSSILLSGAHWFTDILASILLTISLLAVYSALVEACTIEGKK